MSTPVEETMLFSLAYTRHREIEQSGKSIYLKTNNNTLNKLILPEGRERSSPFVWAYLIRSDGQALHIRLRHDQTVYIK
jgi:hypothetical protein